jgi:hypothetical protein
VRKDCFDFGVPNSLSTKFWRTWIESPVQLMSLHRSAISSPSRMPVIAAVRYSARSSAW